MNNRISPLIDPDELLTLQSDPDLVLIDVRMGSNIRDRYAAEHLAGAFFVDLNQDLADIKPDAADGGRHPLPSIQKFAELLQKLGITRTSRVVAYDDKSGSLAATRFWWMVKAAGHEQAQVLDGGYDAAVKAGFPVRAGSEAPRPAAEYRIEDWQLPLADIEDVEKARQDENSLVIDVREKDRFDCLREPLDLIAGHIPGAVNVPFAENLDAEGFYLPPDELREKYTKVLAGREPGKTIVHCGSGVTACHTLLAFDRAGLEIPKLYVGSWSEWSRNDRPMITADKSK